MISVVTFFSIVLAGSALALGYAIQGGWIDALAIAAASILWLLVARRRWTWPAPIALVIFVTMAGRSMWLGVEPRLALVSVVAALTAWDLAYFRLRLLGVEQGASERALERQHVWRLLMADVVGLALASVALALRVRLGIGSALVLGLLAVVGLSQAVRFIRRQSE